ncbi:MULTISPECIES: fimbrial protein [Haemophilus]|uniref:Fimbrial protein, adhesin subunit n=2 Tax=Haemophilus TaxID=724 RepID=A0ABY1VTL3_HAEAE|nr:MULTISPECIES: fimbrial protein [Haemophilus]EGF15306.1 F17a-G protein [Haemophilus aegyptius ATCC 11116]OBX82165.1 fimbrial protein [Haemophilus aegyptius]TMQ43986.1 fimbrial protein [Haemophilus influenzae biotype aegyptius]UAK83201.1 type 1 fimbrial protein [Haemophilus aegyptius]SQH36554.1 fimbrial protein, adhesin subunit [Haemophilus aegyptius]
MNKYVIGIISLLLTSQVWGRDSTSWDGATRMVHVTATDFTLPSPSGQGNLRAYGKDNIPFRFDRMLIRTQDRNKIPLNASWGTGEQCWTIEAKTELTKWGTLNNGTIYKLTDYIGIIIEAGDGYTNNKNVPSNNWSDVFLGGYCTAGEAGAAVEAWPVLLQSPPAGMILDVPRTKIASMRIVKPTYVPQGKTRFWNGFNGFSGKTDWDVWLPAFSLRVEAKTCQLDTPNDLIVVMPTIANQHIPKRGDQRYGGKFQIRLTCPTTSDDNGKKIAAYMTLTDQTDPSNRGDILTLTPQSTAQGVGIKLYKNNDASALSYGPDSSLKGTENQWKFSSRDGEEKPTVEFKAFYVNKDGNITGGTVNAVATYTFSYQ